MIRTFVVLVLTLLLAALFSAMTNAGSANAQQQQQTLPSQPSQPQPSDAYLLGAAVGRALGVRDGAAVGAQHDVDGLAFNAQSYLPPSSGQVCAVYEDFYAEEGYLCVNSQHYFEYSNGYMSGYELGYLDGYIAGYYLTTTLGSLLQPNTQQSQQSFGSGTGATQ
jgi:hypothetical protein